MVPPVFSSGPNFAALASRMSHLSMAATIAESRASDLDAACPHPEPPRDPPFRLRIAPGGRERLRDRRQRIVAGRLAIASDRGPAREHTDEMRKRPGHVHLERGWRQLVERKRQVRIPTLDVPS